MSSTHAWMVCVPAVAFQAAVPLGPPFAVTVTQLPGGIDQVQVSDQTVSLPSTRNATPLMTPAGVGAVP